MSGARKALRSDSNTGQASSPDGSLGLVGRGRRIGVGLVGGGRGRRRRRRRRVAASSVASMAPSSAAGLGRRSPLGGGAVAVGSASPPWPASSAPWPSAGLVGGGAGLASRPGVAVGRLGLGLGGHAQRGQRRLRDLEDVDAAAGGLDLGPGGRGERVGDDEERHRQLAGAEDLHRLVQGPDEPDRAQDVLVDGDRADLAEASCRPRARTRRPRRARRSRRC